LSLSSFPYVCRKCGFWTWWPWWFLTARSFGRKKRFGDVQTVKIVLKSRVSPSAMIYVSRYSKRESANQKFSQNGVNFDGHSDIWCSYLYALEGFITITSSDFNLIIINTLTGLLPIRTFGAQTFACMLTLDWPHNLWRLLASMVLVTIVSVLNSPIVDRHNFRRISPCITWRSGLEFLLNEKRSVLCC